MYTRRFIGASLVGIWLWSISPLCAQALPVPEVISPQNRQVYAWGRTEPAVRIVVRAVPSSPTIRYFVTANIFTTAGRLVERVSLHDDGLHSDAAAGDGVFTNIYPLREKGEFQIRALLQQKDVASRVSREKWSEPVVFSVEQVPYVDITSPNHHAKVASIAKVSAALLVGSEQQPYRPTDDEVRIRCWV
ncbi:MAG: choice-of-anchor X domain-containing protein, partial [Armatimonadota bacterium]